LKTARSRRALQFAAAVVACAALGAAPRAAKAGEEDDLQREIDTQRGSVLDLDRLDELKATGDEITRLRSWLDEAWNLRSKHEYDQVREVLERTRKQADLIRAKITASKLRAQVTKREASLDDLRAKIARTKKSLAETVKKKKTLDEGGGPGPAGSSGATSSGGPAAPAKAPAAAGTTGGTPAKTQGAAPAPGSAP
jgi:hypothetical protein